MPEPARAVPVRGQPVVPASVRPGPGPSQIARCGPGDVELKYVSTYYQSMTDRNPDLEERLAAVERQLADLLSGGGQASSTGGDGAESAADELWMLDGLQARHPEGAVAFAGAAEVPGGQVRWQYGRTADRMLGADWTAGAESLAALGNPVRLMLLQLVLNGVASTAELAAQEQVGTTGQVHHHLRTLMAAGWLEQAGRGRYRVPASRVVPLLTILLAAGVE